MKVVNLRCPNCGTDIKVTENQNSCICPSCESSLMIDDGKFHIVDEAKIKEIAFEKQKYEDERQNAVERKERREAWRKKVKLWTLMEFATSVIGYFFWFVSKKTSFHLFENIGYAIIVVCLIGMFAGPIYLSITRPDVDYEANNPPLIKSKVLFGLLLFFIAFMMTKIVGSTFESML